MCFKAKSYKSVRTHDKKKPDPDSNLGSFSRAVAADWEYRSQWELPRQRGMWGRREERCGQAAPGPVGGGGPHVWGPVAPVGADGSQRPKR